VFRTSDCRIAKIDGEALFFLPRFHTLNQLVEKGLVGQEDDALSFHPRNSGVDIVRGREQKLLYDVDLIA
jgi:hypothetical protein